MNCSLAAFARGCAIAIPALLFLPLGLADWLGVPFQQALAQTSAGAEAEAFAAAKELGTVEAWDAFLSHYPEGFRADLARAYVKKLAGGTSAPVVPSTPRESAGTEPPAYEQTCDAVEGLRSRESNEPAKLHFINESDATLIVQWIDFKGGLKEYATLKPGAEYTQDTYLTHPWIVAYQEGSCRQVFLPAPGTSAARLRPESELANRAPPPPARKEGSSRSADADEPLKCGKTFKPWKGKCVPKKCRSHAYRGSDGDCHCSKGYRLQSGDCVRIHKVKCGPNQVFSSSMGQCITKSPGQGRPPAPPGYKYDPNGNLMQDNGGGE